MINDNKNVYSSVEFDSWAYRSGLIPSEQFLIKNYFDSAQETVEAGTSGGRILLDLQLRGFTKLWGFDYVPEFIDEAKKRDKSGKIQFAVMDATQLSYQDGQFVQAIYLQQIFSMIETEDGRKKAAAEAFRILCKDGVLLISFCCFESRKSKVLYRLLMAWVRLLRISLNRNITIQLLPWFKHAKAFNWLALLDEGPYVYWFRVEEAEKLLVEAGFRIVAVGTDQQILDRNMTTSTFTLRDKPKKGMLYFVCKK